MKALKLDGVTYTEAYVNGLRQPLLTIRDCLIEQNQLPYAAALSEIHAILKYYMEQVDK